MTRIVLCTDVCWYTLVTYIDISIYPSIYPSTNQHIHLFVFSYIHLYHLFIHSSIHLHVYPSIHLDTNSSIYSPTQPFKSPIHPSIYPPIHLSIIHPYIHLSTYVSIHLYSTGHPWYSGSARDFWSTGRAIDPAPGA